MPGRRMLRLWIEATEGAVATEYVILVGFLAFVLVIGAVALATGLNGQYGNMGTLIGGWPTP